ncbi:DUF4396 domain-containing protein [Nocardioides sp. AX2bis]|uniref:DUF4396 domain-containing protein n=1 Tax=Nocardioides sp. AX2bis TaxID=2653157 RepID=UPI001357C3C5|nr:DUF4396 domain-containing protein [Nocardioides sp. AX2bis]
MTNRVPDWVTPVAWVFIALAVAAAAWIAYDVYARRNRRDSVAAEVVWITSALYLGPFAVPLYRRYARPSAPSDQPAAVAGLPGGSASAVAHLIGVPLVIASGLTIAGIDLWVMILVIGAIAILLLTAYERLATNRSRLGAAFVVATVTVLAFDVGMGGWMLLLHYNELMPPATDASFWFLMQLGVLLGLATGYPVVRRLTT